MENEVKTEEVVQEKPLETPVEISKEAEQVPAVNPEEQQKAPEQTAENIEISDEDIKSDIQKRKEFAQKRIDKLVAQGHAKDEEVTRLKEQVSQMREQLIKLQEVQVAPTGEKVYTEDQLNAAEVHAIELSETSPKEAMRLMADIAKERIKNERRAAITEVNRPTPDALLAQEERKNYSRFVNQNKSEDPDFDFTNANSAVRRLAPGLYETNKEYYDSFGALRSVELAADAMRAVERLKLEKSNNRVQKQLVKERVKTSLESGGVSTPSIPSDVKPKLSPVAEYFAERQATFDKLSGLAT